MKHTMKKALSLVLAVAMVLSCMTGLSARAVAAETDTVAVSANGGSIVIGNGYISREFSTSGNHRQSHARCSSVSTMVLMCWQPLRPVFVMNGRDTIVSVNSPGNGEIFM